MSRRDHDRGEHVAGVDLRDRLRARGDVHGLHLAEQLLGVLADRARARCRPGPSARAAFRRRSPRAACPGCARSPGRSAARSRPDRRPARATSSRERRRISRSLRSSQRTVSAPRSRQERHERRLEVARPPPLAAISSDGRAVEQQLAVGEHDRARGVASAPRRDGGWRTARLVPGARERADELPQPLALAGIERRGGLVQREQRAGRRSARARRSRAGGCRRRAAPRARPRARSAPSARASAPPRASGSATPSRRANRRRFSATDSFE